MYTPLFILAGLLGGLGAPVGADECCVSVDAEEEALMFVSDALRA